MRPASISVSTATTARSLTPRGGPQATRSTSSTRTSKADSSSASAWERALSDGVDEQSRALERTLCKKLKAQLAALEGELTFAANCSDCGKNLAKPCCAETATRAIAFEVAQKCEQAFADEIKALCPKLSGVHIAGETAGSTPDATARELKLVLEALGKRILSAEVHSAVKCAVAHAIEPFARSLARIEQQQTVNLEAPSPSSGGDSDTDEESDLPSSPELEALTLQPLPDLPRVAVMLSPASMEGNELSLDAALEAHAQKQRGDGDEGSLLSPTSTSSAGEKLKGGRTRKASELRRKCTDLAVDFGGTDDWNSLVTEQVRAVAERTMQIIRDELTQQVSHGVHAQPGGLLRATGTVIDALFSPSLSPPPSS